jgi:transcription antitermination factor NusG
MSVDHGTQELTKSSVNFQYPWYALRVRTSREKSVSCLLRHKGFHEFLPLYAICRRWSDRIQQVDLPLFPGYVFCRFNAQNRLPILTTPGVVHVVGMGPTPEPVDEGEITALQSVVESGLLMQPWPFLKVGQRVVIEDGPLRNVEGILKDVKGSRNLIISITLLQRSVSVCIERTGVRPLGQSSLNRQPHPGGRKLHVGDPDLRQGLRVKETSLNAEQL